MIINDNKQRSVEIEKIQFINKSLWQFVHFLTQKYVSFLIYTIFFTIVFFFSHFTINIFMILQLSFLLIMQFFIIFMQLCND